MLLVNMIATLEEAMKPLMPAKIDAKYDEQFYDTVLLSAQERDRIDAIRAPEGSILIIGPEEADGIKLCTSADVTATGEAFAKNVLAKLKAELHTVPKLDTVVIPGNATSAVGAAAFGRSVAQALGKPVAAIVTGRGRVDCLFETLSGGMLLAPTAKMLCAWDEVLQQTLKFNPAAKVVAAKDVQEVTRSLNEAALLFEILKDQMLDCTGEQPVFSKPSMRFLKKVVGHSKGNWAILTALLNFELNIVDQLPRPGEPADPKAKVDIVTFGNWVSLPDMNPAMQEMFHYHQFVGTSDIVGALGSSGYARLLLSGKNINGEPQDHSANPDEYLYIGCGHKMSISSMPEHLPLKEILLNI